MLKNIELSIGKNYVTNWGLWEAVREIIQNGLDAEKEGHPLTISYDKATETLSIINDGAYLDISSLVLGNSVKGSDEAIGKYGEGYKLALVVLLRNNKQVKIISGDETWKPTFKESETFNTSVLNIEVEPNNNSEDIVEFEISNITEYEVEKLSKFSLRLGEEINTLRHLRTVDCDYGKVILDAEFAGKFYVEGLFIQSDSNFKYGYDFNSNEVQLDRDRQAINFYDLCELTTKSLLSQTEDFTIVETSISHKSYDGKELEYYYDDASYDFKVGYAKNYIERHNYSEDTFFGTEKEVQVMSVLDKDRPTAEVDKITARWLNDGLGNEDEYRDIRIKSSDKHNQEVARASYESSVLFSLHEWIKTNYRRLSQKQIDNYLEICKNVPVNNINLIRKDIEQEIYDYTRK